MTTRGVISAWLLALTLALTLAVTGSALAGVNAAAVEVDRKTTVRARAFIEVVQENFSRWSDDHGTLTKASHGRLMGDSEIKGEEAAALVTVLKAMHARKSPGASVIERADLHHLRSLQHSYLKTLGRLAHINRSLYATGTPRFGHLAQGPSGNCYFFAPLGWLAHYRPEVITTAIQQQENNDYEVRFPNGETVIVPEPSDAELIGFHSSETLADGYWVAVLEKAVGTLQGQKSDKKSAIPNPILRIAYGGHAMELIRMWTAAEPRVIKLGGTDIELIRKTLAVVAEQKLLTITGTPAHPAAKLPGRHAYAVFGYSAQDDTVTVWNPWGKDFSPRGAPGLANGYLTRHGLFEMPLTDFVNTFSHLRIGLPDDRR